jgi:hypothetical protein
LRRIFFSADERLKEEEVNVLESRFTEEEIKKQFLSLMQMGLQGLMEFLLCSTRNIGR